ncbi:MAG: peptide-methionine (S)-S-oxide reductase MsrA [Candidatus Hydrogenedentes bacterium]|nr:peptide-methionine (S)-S-oxide reductase MsrA [Candidatus Hydrogenedentota bacterium]
MKRRIILGATCLIAAGLLAFAISARTNAAGANAEEEHPTAKAIFGAGCFWGVEDAFRKIDGVTNTTAGYAGGHTDHPSYLKVCSGTTGHAEVVQVTYDPEKVSYDDLLQVFWNKHDPTVPRRQGPEHGEQYRSVIFYFTPEQQAAAEKSKAALESSGQYEAPIQTSIEPAVPFWPAEGYHQQYLEKGREQACRM